MVNPSTTSSHPEEQAKTTIKPAMISSLIESPIILCTTQLVFLWLVADPASHYIQHQRMIGLGCAKRRANNIGPLPSDGRLWRCFRRTTTRRTQNRASNVSSCDCCRIKEFHLILGIFESPTNLQVHVTVVASISYCHDPTATNLLFHSFISSPKCMILS